MPLSTYQNDSTCDLGAPLRPYSEKTPHAAAPRKAVAAGSFRVSAVGEGERGSSQRVCYENRFCFYEAYERETDSGFWL